MKPENVVILGKKYNITYCDKPSDVDLYRRDSLWGQIDYWTRSIRIYDNGRNLEDLWQAILHEILHGIATELNIKCLDGKEHEADVDLLALALADILFRNAWIKE